MKWTIWFYLFEDALEIVAMQPNRLFQLFHWLHFLHVITVFRFIVVRSALITTSTFEILEDFKFFDFSKILEIIHNFVKTGLTIVVSAQITDGRLDPTHQPTAFLLLKILKFLNKILNRLHIRVLAFLLLLFNRIILNYDAPTL